MLGIIFLGEVPEALSIIGYAIIIGIAIIRWHKNLKAA
jgi:drug/metabolite transporter (DMT)-like permease